MAESPAEVLDVHRRMYETLKYPPKALVDNFQGFFDSVLNAAHDTSEARFAEIWYMMFGPAETGLQFLELVARPLYGAATYQVTAGMVQAVDAIYEQSSQKVTHLMETDLPSPTGFLWLDKPVALIDAGGAELCTRALSWGLQTLEVSLRGTPEDSAPVLKELWDGVRLTSWCSPSDRDSIFTDQMQGVFTSYGAPLILSHSVFVPFGQRLATRNLKTDNVEPDDVTRWAHTLWMFMGTEIVSSGRPPIERHARKRGLRSIKQDEVRVIMLRRTHSEGREPSGNHISIEWSCRWVVQGHDRHLEAYQPAYAQHEARGYMDGRVRRCRICGGRTTFVRPYIKGPDGLPFKAPSGELFKVAR
jgi:hypothetical protein